LAAKLDRKFIHLEECGIIGQLAHEFGQMLPLRSFLLSLSLSLYLMRVLLWFSAAEPSRRIIKNPILGAGPAHAIYLYALLSVCVSQRAENSLPTSLRVFLSFAPLF
jgi:hypothetical protein